MSGVKLSGPSSPLRPPSSEIPNKPTDLKRTSNNAPVDSFHPASKTATPLDKSAEKKESHSSISKFATQTLKLVGKLLKMILFGGTKEGARFGWKLGNDIGEKLGTSIGKGIATTVKAANRTIAQGPASAFKAPHKKS